MFEQIKYLLTCLSSVLLLATVQSCMVEDSGLVVCYSHGVESYYTISDIHVDSDKVEVEGRTYYKLVIGAERGEIINEDQEKEFERLSELHKDYGGSHCVHAPCADKFFPDKDIKDIVVTTLDGWDDNHKAGSCINDLCHYIANSFYPYIQNGYKPVKNLKPVSAFYEHTQYPNILVGHSIPIDKPLSEKTEEDSILIGGGFGCKLFVLFILDTGTGETKNLQLKLTDIDGKDFFKNVALK